MISFSENSDFDLIDSKLKLKLIKKLKFEKRFQNNRKVLASFHGLI